METKLGFVLFLLFIDVLVALPLTENQLTEEDNAEEYGDYFEGDMELDYDQMSAMLYPNKRNGLIMDKYRWPGSLVFYEFDPIFETKHIEQIHKALKEIEKVTCLKFLPRNKKTTAYIRIKGDPSGCHSAVGYRGNVQNLNLHINEIGKGCFRLGTVMHEFIHALGFYHQQSASDRDNYVSIIKENIKEGKEHNFNKHPPSVVTDFGVAYDYGSIMHYGPYSFSKNGKKTIVPHDSTAEIGQRLQLSPSDIIKINSMYKCPGYF